jgi:hypothetical protein
VLREGFGPPARLPAWGKALLALAVAGVVAAVVIGSDDRRHLVVEADPTFNVLYDDARLERRRAEPGEALRIEGRAGGLRARFTVEPVELEPYDGDVSSGLLPVLAERRRAELEERLAGFRLTDEGRARVNDSPGYQLGYRAEGLSARDVYVVEGPDSERGYLLSLELEGRTGAARKLAFQARRAFRSFRFGTDRG